jgi:hypothetical protein
MTNMKKYQTITLHIWMVLRTQNLCKLRQNRHNSEFPKFTLIAVALDWSLPVHSAKILMKVLTAAGLITHWAAHARKKLQIVPDFSYTQAAPYDQRNLRPIQNQLSQENLRKVDRSWS